MAEEKTVDVNTDNLDDFNDLLSGAAKEKVTEEVVEDTSDPDDSLEDQGSEEVEENQEEVDVNDDETADDDSSATEKASKPKAKKTAQERINELTAARREAEREADKWKAIAEERERSQKSKEVETEPETAEERSAPNPDDKEKYPLGDMDPQYQQDMLDYKLEARIAQLEKQREEAEVQTAQQRHAEAMQTAWQAKLEEASETYPDFRDTVNKLENVFEGVDEQYGMFIAQTIMTMEKGPDVLYHLAQHPDEAEALVKSDPVNAAMALGRLEASFNETKPKAKKTTSAPKPPGSVNKGNSPRMSVRPDTDDLDAFSDAFFKE